MLMLRHSELALSDQLATDIHKASSRYPSSWAFFIHENFDLKVWKDKHRLKTQIELIVTAPT